MLPYLAGHPVDLQPDGEQVVIDSSAALVDVVARGAVELHPLTTTTDDPDRPSWVVMDIQADDGEDALVIARLHRTALEHLGVDARPVALGDGELQIWIPIARRYSHDQADRWAENVATAIGASVPDVADRVSIGPIDRPVAPYSVRATPGAPVAVPIAWDELDDLPGRWTIRDVGERIANAGDPLAPLVNAEQRLPRL